MHTFITLIILLVFKSTFLFKVLQVSQINVRIILSANYIIDIVIVCVFFNFLYEY